MTFAAEQETGESRGAIRIHPVDEVEVLIVGSGFSGLGLAARLEQAGIRSYRILEAADDLGGTWRDNTYPGCGCDIPSPLYSFSFDQKPDWSRLFASQPEILDYLREVARRRGLTEHIRFGQTVDKARWHDDDARWEVITADGSRHRARFLVSAVGPLHHPSYPDLTGIENFEGPVFHSATWRHDVDLTGKRVAVIGTGASAIQFVPAVVDQVEKLTVFQRTPPWIVPKADRPFTDRHRTLARLFPPYRWWVRWRLFWLHENRAAGFVTDPAAMQKTEDLARDLIRRQVPDPELRAKVTPDYAVGCKRLLISKDWYPAIGRPNVEIRTGGVREVQPGSVVGDDGTKTAADVLIFGTGFDAQNTIRIDIEGRDGLRLADAWSAGNQAYLGTTVAGFPNLFLMVGPNTGLGHNSQIFMIESQARYIVELLQRLRRRGARTVEVRPTVQESFNRWLDRRMDATVWQNGGCRSWYQDPRSGRNTVLWPDTSIAFWRRTRRPRLSDYLRDGT
ncbi:Predicted flavoprotein CzcO associated with the cation diffusion facilitator CzcD [Pseudonocardia ammonioxydans]|uniref:Predicted flavoprotein CzcO associated with the cation diffusion facilitator CzcD n=2 Tax=Pseudonocardia ammonioxydans TaxID=260086 RepID=A0A1I5H1H9_PSUAM|nr:Predicted flavoprotein CzcO associated with the cation diffusion facilitator CzcD [Pseudonocardia ammonioxydans]